MEITNFAKKPEIVENGIPFYHQLKSDLKRRIANQEFALGSLMPTEQKLMAEYQVSRITVARAVIDLAKEGLVHRRPGKGTIVTKPMLKLTSNDIVGLIMPTTGHLFGKLAGQIIGGLTEHDQFCLMVDPVKVGDVNRTYEKIKALIEKSPSVLVIEGYSNFPFELLAQYTGRVIFIDTYETTDNYPSTRILSDYREGGRMVVEHFLQAGFTKVNYWGHPVTPSHMSQLAFLDGARLALRNRHLPEDNLTILTATEHEAQAETQIDELLRSLEKPMAFFCHADNLARWIYGAARRLNLQIPQDISVVGYYNTPWCEVFDPALTSVSICEDEIAAQLIEAIITGTERQIYIKPKMILRKSTCDFVGDA